MVSSISLCYVMCYEIPDRNCVRSYECSIFYGFWSFSHNRRATNIWLNTNFESFLVSADKQLIHFTCSGSLEILQLLVIYDPWLDGESILVHDSRTVQCSVHRTPVPWLWPPLHRKLRAGGGCSSLSIMGRSIPNRSVWYGQVPVFGHLWGQWYPWVIDNAVQKRVDEFSPLFKWLNFQVSLNLNGIPLLSLIFHTIFFVPLPL